MSSLAESTDLLRVVVLNECAKVVLDDSYQVSLRALDALVRSTQAGTHLRGFATVSQQMREWSRELQMAVQNVTKLTAQQVNLVSQLVKRRRLAKLLELAGRESAAEALLAELRSRAATDVETALAELQRLRHVVRTALEELQQLGLMACVLSSVALIEAAAGNAEQRRDLSIVSKEFSDRSDKVTQNIRLMLAREREVRS